MDPYLAIASKRDERAYADTPIPAEVRQRILDAGRLSGSSKNRQRWEFVVVSGDKQAGLAEAVYAPENVASAALVVAIVGEAGAFDTGRCAQNLDLVGQDWRGGTQLAEQTGAHVRPVDANLDRANESRRQLVDRHAGDPGRMRERPVNARPHQDLDTTALRDTPQRLGLWIEAVDRHVDQAAPAGLRKGAQLLHSRVLVVDQQVVARLIRVLGPGRP